MNVEQQALREFWIGLGLMGVLILVLVAFAAFIVWALER
jgi:hypothetical protein